MIACVRGFVRKVRKFFLGAKIERGGKIDLGLGFVVSLVIY